jgi:indolepyruvate ferredoxin oxidoreductase
MDLPNSDLQQREIYNPMLDLGDKYTVASGRIFLSGIRALVRLLMMQKKRDAAAHELLGIVA